ncbi:MAG: YihY/virulence factor BrkB family protein [Gammaproteobacteria bacterium]|nr:YihY/virulence factor BrkB family protein [Gammaproteobacteria bacterium]MBT8134837.1 YihY/virulence factor BrkB family protein [Gammaproteobacteria bacterium]
MDNSRLRFVLDNPWQFFRRVLAGFSANQGLLLSGAVAYYTLLTIVPMFALIITVLSQIQETQPLLESLREYLLLIAPNQADALISQISAFQQNWKTVGLMGILLLLFFSSFAFTSLENAMSVIFFHRVAIHRRHFLISAIIPYCYIFLLAVGMLLVSMVSGSLHSLDARSVSVMGQEWSLSGLETALIYMLGIIGEILLLTSIYLVMPVGKLSLRHALIGGITAAFLWEITRHILVWYFSTLSLVNIVYGAFATVIIILLSLEAAAIILLLGAQVIAEYERIGSSSTATHGLQT